MTLDPQPPDPQPGIQPEIQPDPLVWKQQLIDQLDWHWQRLVRPRLDGLTDAEYFWEPVGGAWSIRPRAQATTNGAVGDGDFVCDYQFPEPEPAPVTTIAWRLGHISVGVLGVRASSHFGDGLLSLQNAPWPGSAQQALSYLDQQYEAWTSGIRRLSDADLARAVGPAEGPWSAAPFAALIFHINREVLHHGAEVLLLRDLFRASRAGTAFR